MTLFNQLEENVQYFLKQRGINPLDMKESLKELLEQYGSVVLCTPNKQSFMICSCGTYIEDAKNNQVCPICTGPAKQRKIDDKAFEQKEFAYNDFHEFTTEGNFFVFKKGAPKLKVIESKDGSYSLEVQKILKPKEERFEVKPNGEHLKSKELLSFLIGLSSKKFIDAIQVLNTLLADEYQLHINRSLVKDNMTVQLALIYFSVKELRTLLKSFNRNSLSNLIYDVKIDESTRTDGFVIKNIIEGNFILNTTKNGLCLKHGETIEEILDIPTDVVNFLNGLTDNDYFIQNRFTYKDFYNKVGKDLFFMYLKDVKVLASGLHYINDLNELFEHGYDKQELFDYIVKIKENENLEERKIVYLLIDYIESEKQISDNAVNEREYTYYPDNLTIDNKFTKKEKDDLMTRNISSYLDVMYNDINIDYSYKYGGYNIVKPSSTDEFEQDYGFYYNRVSSNVPMKEIIHNALQNNERLYYFVKDTMNKDRKIIIGINLEQNSVNVVAKYSHNRQSYDLTGAEKDLMVHFAQKFKLTFNQSWF